MLRFDFNSSVYATRLGRFPLSSRAVSINRWPARQRDGRGTNNVTWLGANR
jgi:hypothetical protein